jgi:hypothetical protein
MTKFSLLIRPYVDAELAAGALALQQGRAAEAFAHLERAHVLAQPSTSQHVRVHLHMLHWGWAQRDLRECWGQLLRIVGAATKTALGLVPIGNTGGSRVSPAQAMPVPSDLEVILRQVYACLH